MVLKSLINYIFEKIKNNQYLNDNYHSRQNVIFQFQKLKIKQINNNIHKTSCFITFETVN